MAAIYVRFHVGGGRQHGFYQKGGITEFCDESDFQKLISICSNNLFEQNRDEKGRFCPNYLTNCNGTLMVDHKDMNAKTGVLEWDTIYDTDYVREISECSEEEIELIRKSNKFKSSDLEDWLDKH